MKKLLFLLFAITLAFTAQQTQAQVNIANGQTITENFDGIGLTETAALPTGWKVDKLTDVRLLGDYTTAVAATERRGGNNMSTTASNGIYNFGAGDAATATDRAVGFLSSGSATKSGNLYLALNNNGAATINNFTISFDVEKYRNGTRLEGFAFQMHYSLDGTTWTDAGTDFNVTFAGADTANNGFASAPGLTLSVTAKTLNVVLTPGATLYLAWNYSVASGTFTSNAKALGIDNVSIQAAAASTGNDATLSALSSSLGILSPSFNPVTLNYTVALPFGTTATPTVTATPSNSLAGVTVTAATDVTSATAANRTTTIVVVSEDLSQTKTYTVEFNVATTQGTDATLSNLTSSVTPLSPAFSSSVYFYTVVLPFGATTTPTVTATTTDPYANATIVPATDVTSSDSLLRTTVVTVVAEDGTTTLVYKVQFNPSNITVVDVATIAALRAGLTDGTVYRLTGEAALSYKQTYRNQKFVQDATAAIMIDDFNNILNTPYNIGDGITNLIGTLTVYNQMLQFTPTVNPGAATSTGNVVVAHLKTVSQVLPEDQAKLIRILNANFANPTGNFATNQNYNLTDATGTIVFRTNFHEADYIGTPVPTFTVDVKGIYIQYLSTKQVTARFATDIEQSTSTNTADYNDFAFEAYPNPSYSDINFAFETEKAETIVFSISDINGKVIFNHTAQYNTGAHIITWENANAAPGVYFYNVQMSNQTKNGKLIITK